jgi:hypothetical protein
MPLCTVYPFSPYADYLADRTVVSDTQGQPLDERRAQQQGMQVNLHALLREIRFAGFRVELDGVCVQQHATVKLIEEATEEHQAIAAELHGNECFCDLCQ